jgi:hypothetical protein
MVAVTATPDPTTGSMLVQVEQTVARDLFTRVVAGGWGNATTGQAWTVTGGVAGDYSVTGTVGQVITNSINVARLTHYDTLSVDHDTTIQWISPASTPTGASWSVGVVGRYTDASNYYLGHMLVAPGGVVTATVSKRVLGVTTDLASFVLPVTHAGNAQYFMRLAVCGTSIKFKAWSTLVAEPDWVISTNDWDLTTGTRTGTRSLFNVGVTNPMPFPWTFDNMVTIVGQPFRLYRIVGGEYTEVRGSPSNSNQQTAAAATATATFWDNEGPFNVSTTYAIRSNCTDVDLATSTPVTLDADFGWLRDPTDPSRNIEIAQFSFFDPCVDEEAVVFSGLGGYAYANASGIFPIIDAQRVRTVAQTRKRYATSLSLTSFSLDDIINLEDLYAPGTVLALSLPTGFGWGLRTSGTDYVVIGDIESSYLGVDQELSVRIWTMPMWLTGPPADTSEGGTGGNGIGGGDATYDVLRVSVLGTTYNSLTASALTYDQVAAGTGY